MRSLLTGYAGDFNRRYHRSGHVFQNRFKSILCEEDPYFLDKEVEENENQRSHWIKTWEISSFVKHVCQQLKVNPGSLSGGGKSAAVSRARAVLSHLWLNKMGNNGRELARALNIKPVTLYNAAKRGKEQEDIEQWDLLLK